MSRFLPYGLLLWLTLVTTATAEPISVIPDGSIPGARQPQVAVNPAGTVFVTFGADNSLYCVRSVDGGRSFLSPVKVGDAGLLALGMRRGPRIAATATAVVITAVYGERGGGKDGDVLAWRSTDSARTWKGPVRINSVPGSGREGLHGLAAGPDGMLYCVWLDLRAQRSQVYGAASLDGGATWQREQLVYAAPEGPVCQCCQPSATVDAKGAVHVLWRNLLAGDRDMYLISSTDGGQTFGQPIKLGLGTWHLNACPMDGGGLAVGQDGRVVTIWRRQNEVFRSIPGEPELPLGRGEQGWAAAGPGGVHLVWINGRPGKLLALSPGRDRRQQLSEHADAPVVAGVADGNGPVVVVWEEQGKPQRLRAEIMAPRGAPLNSGR